LPQAKKIQADSPVLPENLRFSGRMRPDPKSEKYLSRQNTHYQKYRAGFIAGSGTAS
jgi:hypothetical protein